MSPRYKIGSPEHIAWIIDRHVKNRNVAISMRIEADYCSYTTEREGRPFTIFTDTPHLLLEDARRTEAGET